MLRVIHKTVHGVFKKRKGAALSTEIAGYILAAGLLLVIGIVGIRIIIDGINTYRANKELEVLAAACQAYEYSAKNSQPPSELGKLVSGLDATASVTNETKQNFVTKDTWTSDSGSFLDPWGNQYQYDSSARTITSTNNGKTALTTHF